MIEQFDKNYVFKVLNDVMVRVLELGQCSVTEHQFLTFRKLVMDYFAEGRRNLNKDRRGESETKVKGVVDMCG